jgi:hypothetical protein
MSYWELGQDKAIKNFLKNNKNPSKEDLFNLFYENFLHPDLETEFTHKVAKNVIEISYDYYLKLSHRKKFHFLRALGKLFDVVLSIKIWEFQLGRDDASWYWKGIPTYFLTLSHLTEPLETLRQEIGIVDKNRLYSKIICVEGETENNFIKTLYLTTRASNFDFSTYNYQGKGEIKNLIHFVKEKNRQGIRVFISYDKDRQSDSFNKKIKKKCKVEKIFEFKKDFESSFPPKILKYALEDYIKRYTKLKIKLNIKDIDDLLSQTGPFLKSFEKKYNIKINKVKLGSILGKVMASIVNQHWNEIFNKKQKKKSFRPQIFKFLKFLIS